MVTDAVTGQTQTEFTKFYEQFVHVIIVDDSLTFFTHTHPVDFQNGQFVVRAALPKPARYHMYLNFQPYGAIEQSFVFNLAFGAATGPDPAARAVQTTASAGTYAATLATPVIRAADASVGKAEIDISLTKDGRPVTDIQQYMGAFGHLTLVNDDTYEFLHIHPSIVPSSGTAVAGPGIAFVPLGLYGPIKPGTYRAFAEFKPDGTYELFPFTLKIQ
jgi:hypothetical protein